MAEKLDPVRKVMQERKSQEHSKPSFEMNSTEERDRVWRAIEANGMRIDHLQETIQTTIIQAVRDAMPRALLTEEELIAVQLVIRKQAQSIAFRQKIIDNTVTGLVWMLVAGVGVMVREYLMSHGWKA